MEKPKLRMNVVNRRFTFQVDYRDRESEIITIEAESVDAASLKLPPERFYTCLLSNEPVEAAANE